MRLLIVEDEKQIWDMVAKSLYAAGYEVDTCYDGEEALTCILSENYDMEKPFHLQELEARIRSLTRRKFVQKEVCLVCGEIKFDTMKREAYARGEAVPLTRKENGILE